MMRFYALGSWSFKEILLARQIVFSPFPTTQCAKLFKSIISIFLAPVYQSLMRFECGQSLPLFGKVHLSGMNDDTNFFPHQALTSMNVISVIWT